MQSIYSGNYKSIKAIKKDEDKLRKLGYFPYLFFKDDMYTLKVFSCQDTTVLNNLKARLMASGFDVYIGD